MVYTIKKRKGTEKMKRKKHTKGVRVCAICGNEIYYMKTVKCPFCGYINKKDSIVRK